MSQLKQTFNYPIIHISYNKNDKDSIYVVDLVGAMLGIKEARENILEFCKRQEDNMQEIKNNIPKMLDTINKFFEEENNHDSTRVD